MLSANLPSLFPSAHYSIVSEVNMAPTHFSGGIKFDFNVITFMSCGFHGSMQALPSVLHTNAIFHRERIFRRFQVLQVKFHASFARKT